jgi:hypothetical protein
MDNKFRYIIFPDNIYKVSLLQNGEPVDVEVPGRFILDQLQRTHDLDSKMLDNEL